MISLNFKCLIFRIKNVYNHPKYYLQDGRPYNDISLLETASDLYTSDDNAAPACLPSKGFNSFAHQFQIGANVAL